MLKPDEEMKGLCLSSKSLASLDGFLSTGDAIVMIGSEYIGTGYRVW